MSCCTTPAWIKSSFLNFLSSISLIKFNKLESTLGFRLVNAFRINFYTSSIISKLTEVFILESIPNLNELFFSSEINSLIDSNVLPSLSELTDVVFILTM